MCYSLDRLVPNTIPLKMKLYKISQSSVVQWNKLSHTKKTKLNDARHTGSQLLAP